MVETPQRELSKGSLSSCHVRHALFVKPCSSSLGAWPRRDGRMPAAEIGALLRHGELRPGGKIGQHHRGDVRDGVAGATNELAIGKPRVHVAEKMFDPRPPACRQ